MKHQKQQIVSTNGQLKQQKVPKNEDSKPAKKLPKMKHQKLKKLLTNKALKTENSY